MGTTKTADPQITEYIREADVYANEINKFCRTFNQFILDLTESTKISGAAMVANTVKLVHKVRCKSFGQMKFEDNIKLFDSDYLQAAFDRIISHDKEIGMLVIDEHTIPEAFELLKEYLEYLLPPVMVIGKSKQEKYLRGVYTEQYSFSLHGKGSRELGKVYYNAR